MKPIPSHFKKSNSDDKGLPLRLGVGGVRDESKPYQRVRWKTIYVYPDGVQIVPADEEPTPPPKRR